MATQLFDPVTHKVVPVHEFNLTQASEVMHVIILLLNMQRQLYVSHMLLYTIFEHQPA